MVGRVGDKGSLNNNASKRRIKVVWRLKRGNGGEGVVVMVLRGMGSEFVSYDGKD